MGQAEKELMMTLRETLDKKAMLDETLYVELTEISRQMLEAAWKLVPELSLPKKL